MRATSTASARTAELVGAGVGAHLQDRAVAPGYPALHEPGAATGQVTVVAGADRTGDPLVHDLRDAPGVGEAQPAHRAVGEQHDVVGHRLLVGLHQRDRPVLPGRLADEVPADATDAGAVGGRQPQPERRDHQVAAAGDLPHRQHPLVGVEAAGEAVGNVAAQQVADRGQETGTPHWAPIARSRRAIRYCSSGTRSPNSRW